MALSKDEPDKPNWINFFDGELFKRYQDFVATRDFSKVLVTLREGITYKEKPKWPLQEITLAQSVQTMDSSNYEMGDNSEIISQKYATLPVDFATEEWRRQRRKRTRTYILLGILILCLLALLVALLVHFHVTKSLFGSGPSVTNPGNQATPQPRIPGGPSSTSQSTVEVTPSTTRTTAPPTIQYTVPPTLESLPLAPAPPMPLSVASPAPLQALFTENGRHL
ncbi:uncharacterized protein LOC121373705 [Gigantopelta aegis]|uniref:uncharacterized protein LOC121373705 n=1 Tax=Gigantopelta aegis TaxID=1735272 RepID=UPI001B88C950|nr:uncharacterized protein LOC121373705 [Gigantopelta aegis]